MLLERQKGRHMKKKILAVMLSAVMAVTMLVGCGDSVETGGNAETNDSMEITETEDENNTETEVKADDSETETEHNSQEETDEEDEIIQTLDLEMCGNLVSLLEATAASMYGNSVNSPVSLVINSANAQEWITQLYQGSWANIGDILCDLCSMGEWSNHTPDIAYIDEIMNQPETVEILNRLYDGYEWVFNEEQLEYLAYSITGDTWEMQNLDSISDSKASNTLTETERYEDKVLLYFAAIGDGNKIVLDSMEAERIDAVNWKVTADGFAYGLWLSPTKIAEFAFTVTYNADSCFDGYSITGIEVTPIDNSGWAQAYLDRMDEEAQQEMLEYDLIYLDNDNVPELVGGQNGYWVSVYTWHDGQIYEVMNRGYNSGGNFGYSYIPYTGFVTYEEAEFAGEIRYNIYEKLNENYELEQVLNQEAYEALGLSGKEWIFIEGRLNSYDMRSVLEGFIR